MKRPFATVALLTFLGPTAYAASPPLEGYGIQPCANLVAALSASGPIAPNLTPDAQAFVSWMEGYVSAANTFLANPPLNPMTAGNAYPTQLLYLTAFCTDHPQEQVATAAASLLADTVHNNGSVPNAPLGN